MISYKADSTPTDNEAANEEVEKIIKIISGILLIKYMHVNLL